MTGTAAPEVGATTAPSARTRPPDRPGWLASGAGLLALAVAMFLPWLVSLLVAAAAIAISLVVLGMALGSRGPGVGHGISGLVTSLVALLVAGSVALLPQFDVALVGRSTPDQSGGLVPQPTPSPGPASSSPASEKEIVFLPPTDVGASAAAPDSQDAAGNPVTFGAVNAVDGEPTTAWRVPGDGVGATLVLTFDRPVHVAWIGVIPGYAKTDPVDGSDRFAQNRRVSSAQFQFSDGQALTFNFADQPQLQQAAIDLDTRQVAMQILSSTTAERDFTAVSEVEVYGWAIG